mgnify:CR=1 FL=1
MNHIGGKGEGSVGKDKADNADGLNPFHVASCKPGRHNRGQEDSETLENGIGQGEGASGNLKLTRDLNQKFIAERHDGGHHGTCNHETSKDNEPAIVYFLRSIMRSSCSAS